MRMTSAYIMSFMLFSLRLSLSKAMQEEEPWLLFSFSCGHTSADCAI